MRDDVSGLFEVIKQNKTEKILFFSSVRAALGESSESLVVVLVNDGG